jgi:hypothetical protein
VAEARGGITARQLSARLGLPPATTYRIVNVLVREEYLARLPGWCGFGLGARAAELASVVAAAGGPCGRCAAGGPPDAELAARSAMPPARRQPGMAARSGAPAGGAGVRETASVSPRAVIPIRLPGIVTGR